MRNSQRLRPACCCSSCSSSCNVHRGACIACRTRRDCVARVRINTRHGHSAAALITRLFRARRHRIGSFAVGSLCIRAFRGAASTGSSRSLCCAKRIRGINKNDHHVQPESIGANAPSAVVARHSRGLRELLHCKRHVAVLAQRLARHSAHRLCVQIRPKPTAPEHEKLVVVLELIRQRRRASRPDFNTARSSSTRPVSRQHRVRTVAVAHDNRAWNVARVLRAALGLRRGEAQRAVFHDGHRHGRVFVRNRRG
mmetsp:Transcript_1526/g.3209  ORF Transcript_1526/g.3209 Transcript_1526/m.3209 type:complete len:254 (+) Transcript_1526:600-1361(+)